MRIERLAAVFGGIAVLGLLGLLLAGFVDRKQIVVPEGTLGERVTQYRQMRYKGAKEVLRDKGEKPGSRTLAMYTMVMINAREAPEIIAPFLNDAEPEVRRKAAEWLAIYGDKRGLEVQAKCVRTGACKLPFESARLLGNAARVEYAEILEAQIRRVLISLRFLDGRWQANTDDRAMLLYATIGLARMGRKEDWDLILDAVRRRPAEDSFFLQALGYVDDPRSREVLWSAYKKLLRTPTCSDAGLGVPALLPLSRLGEPVAIQHLRDVLKGVGTRESHWEPNTFPTLCRDREEAFLSLKPRDAVNFAETVFEVAAQEPEGPGTLEAWRALGVMRPKGFGERVLKLAVSKPRWQLVSNDMLNVVVIALDPSLNEVFWTHFETEVVPEMLGEKRLVEMELGRLMFTGTSKWTGD